MSKEWRNVKGEKENTEPQTKMLYIIFMPNCNCFATVKLAKPLKTCSEGNKKKKNNGLIGLILQCANLCRTDVKQKCTAFMAKGKCRKF